MKNYLTTALERGVLSGGKRAGWSCSGGAGCSGGERAHDPSPGEIEMRAGPSCRDREGGCHRRTDVPVVRRP